MMYVTPMHEIAETVKPLLTYAAFACAAAVGVVLAATAISCGTRMLLGSAKKLTAASLVGAALIGGMVVVGTENSAKPGTNGVSQVEGGTNMVTQAGGAGLPSGPLMLGISGLSNPAQQGSEPTVTDDDITAGWRLVSVSSNVLGAAIFSMPANATVWESAQASGRGLGAWHIPLDGWRFTYGDVGWTNGFAWVEGFFRSRFDSRANEIRLLSERLALCPAANWSRYNLAASRAWCATNDVDGLVVTFENAAVGDDPAKIANVQMELFPRTGEVALRYDLANVGDATYTAGLVVDGVNHLVEVGAGTREVVFQRVHPDDWDMDGIPNLLDVAPREPSPNAGCNQTDEWAMAAFPSNSAEIATMGYAAWAAARGAETNRLLVAFSVASANGAWPVCLAFGDKQVMCDGKEEIVFPIDCGARYAFSISGGELASVSVLGVGMRDMTWLDWYSPWDFSIGDVSIHQESAREGWLGSLASVEVAGLDVTHFYNNDQRQIVAELQNCHEDAYRGCTWSGGPGITFSNANSLSTVISWQTADSVGWATNYVTLVTTYEGDYAVTNGYVVSVGFNAEPSTRFMLGCPAVQFVNDGVGGDRPERVYRVSLNLLAPLGTRGNVTLSCSGSAVPTLYHDEERTRPVTLLDTFPLAIPTSGGFEDGMCVYMTSTNLGTGTVSASLTIEDDSDAHEESVPFEVIEPIRKLVNTEVVGEHVVNPPCLVSDGEALLKVDFKKADGGMFSVDDVQWSVVSGPGIIESDGLSAYVAPTSSYGSVTVEARFNGDAVQPRFVLPIVRPKSFDVKVFIVPPSEDDATIAWEVDEIEAGFSYANLIFSQLGVTFNLVETRQLQDSSYWHLQYKEQYPTEDGGTRLGLSRQLRRLVDTYKRQDCIEVYFIGNLLNSRTVGLKTDWGVIITKAATSQTLAHELGHVLGLADCFEKSNGQLIDHGDEPITREMLEHFDRDWGRETGRGFYEKDDTLARIIKSYLMNGISRSERIDIPHGAVHAWAKKDQNVKGFIHVGARYRKPSWEIYSK